MPLFTADEHDLAEVPPLLRFGLSAAFLVGFLAPAAAALGVFRFVILVAGFFAADAFFVLFFLGDVEADALLVSLAVNEGSCFMHLALRWTAFS